MMTARNTIGVMGWTMVALLAMGAADPTAAQTTLYVDDSVSASGNGQSWATAMDDIQPALTAAAAPGSTVTQIRVAQGTYKPSRRENPNNPRSVTFRLVHGVTLRGGYAGVGAPDPNDYDPEAYPTILSGDLNDNDQPNFVHYGENAYHVLLAENSTVTLRGVTVTGGNANGSTSSARSGAGMRVLDGAVTISNSRFLQNQSREDGGALFIGNVESVTIQRCVFHWNRDEDGVGGAVRARGIDEALIEDSVFSLNTATISGALDIDGQCVIRRCSFEDNVSNFAAGALLMVGESGSELNSCLFVGNVTSWLGGGALLDGADITVINCAFTRNQAGIGAGIGGGGMFVHDRVILKNCTIAENEGSGNMLGPTGAEVVATNCIIWGNFPEQIAMHDNLPPPPPEGNTGAPASISYSCVQGGWPGSHNTGVDPDFAQPGCRNFRLLANSHYLNAGSNAAVPAGLTHDLDGQPRIQNGIVAMGAYESPHDPLPPAACAYIIPHANTVWLIPEGAINQPLEHSAIGITSTQGTANANAMLQIFDDNLHPNAGGYAALGENFHPRRRAHQPHRSHLRRG